jgi:hypothetical protein
MSDPIFRLFILGAGFSKPASLPLGLELLEEIRERIKAKSQRYDWDGPLEKEIDDWRVLYPNKELTLEDVLAYSHRKHFLGLIGSEEMYSHGSRTIVEVRRLIQEILITKTPAIPPPLYAKFAKHLTAYDTVFTFNYDTLLEETLDHLGISYSLTPEWWLANENKKIEYSEQYIDIIKLHGSIDWYDRNYHDATRRHYQKLYGDSVPDDDPIFGPKQTIPYESLAKGRVENGYGENLLGRVFRVTNHRKYFPEIVNSYFQVVPFFLPPAYDKILGHDPIRDLWENMHRTLDGYSAIIIIGYSMPDYDGYAYEALGHLIASYQKRGSAKTYFGHRRVPVQIITLGSSKNEVLGRIPFLQRQRTRIWHKGFNFSSLNWLDWGD